MQRSIYNSAILLLTITPLVYGVEVGPDEMLTARQWVEASFAGTAPTPPFAFSYGGQPSAFLLKAWELKRDLRNLDDQRTERRERERLILRGAPRSLRARRPRLDAHGEGRRGL